MLELKYPLFDGERVWEGACVRVEDGMIALGAPCDPAAWGEGFLLPSLIDAHTHVGTALQVHTTLQHGITADRTGISQILPGSSSSGSMGNRFFKEEII